MSIEWESNCNGCPECIGCYQGRTSSPHFYCDDCGQEIGAEDLYDLDGAMLCKDCLADRHTTIDKEIRDGHIVLTN